MSGACTARGDDHCIYGPPTLPGCPRHLDLGLVTSFLQSSVVLVTGGIRSNFRITTFHFCSFGDIPGSAQGSLPAGLGDVGCRGSNSTHSLTPHSSSLSPLTHHFQRINLLSDLFLRPEVLLLEPQNSVQETLHPPSPVTWV